MQLAVRGIGVADVFPELVLIILGAVEGVSATVRFQLPACGTLTPESCDGAKTARTANLFRREAKGS